MSTSTINKIKAIAENIGNCYLCISFIDINSIDDEIIDEMVKHHKLKSKDELDVYEISLCDWTTHEPRYIQPGINACFEHTYEGALAFFLKTINEK